MVELNTPLKYHMNDLVYYLGLSTGGHLGKQIAYLGSMGAMMKGMLYQFQPTDRMKADGDERYEVFQKIQAEIDEYIGLVDMLEKAYVPMLDTNPYLFNKARRVRKGVQIAEVLAFHIVTKHNLIAGNIMRQRLAEQFGKDRIKGTVPEGSD